MSPSEHATLPRPATRARKPSDVVFPVVPQRTTFVRRIALIVLATTALGAGAQRLLSTAPVALDLVATLTPTVIAPPAPVPAPVQPAPAPATNPVRANNTPPDSVAARRAPAPVERRPATPKATRPPPPTQRRAVTAPATLPALPPPPVFQDTPANAAPGSLIVSAAPWGAVTVDGNPVGNSPVMGIALPAGQHRVRIVRDGFEPYDRIVTVAPGETLRLTGIVLNPRRNP